MKRFYILLLLGILLFSCGQSELEFSCDPVINAFVSENREELSRITVNELTSYETELQRAVFTCLAHEPCTVLPQIPAGKTLR